MKKFILLGVIAFSTINVFSQFEKGNLLFSVSGNFMKSSTSSGVTSNLYSTTGKYINTSLSAGLFLSNNLIICIGVDFNHANEDRINNLLINNTYQVESLNLKSKAFLPHINFGYYHRIIDKLYFNTNLSFSYGRIKSEYKSDVVSSSALATNNSAYFTLDYDEPYILYSKKEKSEVDYFSTSVIPELSYFLSPKFALSLGFGGIEYSLTDWNTDNYNWAINFNPSYWSFGIKFKI